MNRSDDELLKLYSDPTPSNGGGDRVTVTLSGEGVSEILRRHQRRIAEKTGSRPSLGAVASDLLRLVDTLLARQATAASSSESATEKAPAPRSGGEQRVEISPKPSN